MSPRRNDNPCPFPLREVFAAVGDAAPSPEEKLQYLRSIREHSDEAGHSADRFLIQEITSVHTGLLEAQKNQSKLKEVLEKLGATPWHLAVFLGHVTTREGPRAMVIHGNTRRVVGLADEVDGDALRCGEEVLLSNELNVVMAVSPDGAPTWGEIATFGRKTEDGRLLLQRRGGEQIIVRAAFPLDGVELRSGDLVRWHRDCWMAFERLPREEGNQFLIEDVPDLGRDQVGGQDATLETLLSSLTATLVAPEKAARYGLRGRETILMVGAPGCGKTLMARVASSELKRLTGERCAFAVVKPGEFEDPYVGVTQQRIRNCFEALRRAARDRKVVLFLDEIETVGRIRGGLTSQLSDKFLGALLAEIDGFTDRESIAIIAATNRKDLVDPALLERLSDVEILVGRPDMLGARAIFGIHLPESIPYAETGGDTRGEIIDTAVTRLYGPNADNTLCVVRFRDGKTRTVCAAELASGRTFEQMCRAAKRDAFLREHREGQAGVRVADIENAVCDAMQRLSTTLTPRNLHAYLSDLPQDVDVVSVEPVVRRVARPHRYLNVA